MEFVLRLEDLDVQGAIWSKVFHGPGSEDGLMILRRLEPKGSEMDGGMRRKRGRERERGVETPLLKDLQLLA